MYKLSLNTYCLNFSLLPVLIFNDLEQIFKITETPCVFLSDDCPCYTLYL